MSAPSPAQPAATESSPRDRRRFLKDAAVVASLGTAASALVNPRMVHAAGDEVIKYALIGCGGRGTGAAVDAAEADKNAKLVALADVFPDRVENAKKNLAGRLGPQYAVADDQCFHGFDAYKQVMATDADLVLLCTTPHFRPLHLRAAIEAGKHVFCEKPVAVDSPGVRHVLESTKMAKEKNLSLVSGLCWRYDWPVRETIKRIHDGAIGDIVTIQENYLTGELWHRGNNPNWSEMEYQLRNWLYFTWLSGDHIAEQHIHSIDKALWLMKDEPPVACYGLGGRQTRTDEKWGNIFDHFSVVYEWKNGVRCYAMSRQQPTRFHETEDYVFGTKGTAKVLAKSIMGETKWNYEKKGNEPGMYLSEHQELSKSIREGKPINNGEYMSYSTMMTIMGRMACYTGDRLTWEQALNSKEDLTPEKYEWGKVVLPNGSNDIAKPGRTKFV
jgi:predicted dehydrogenase